MTSAERIFVIIVALSGCTHPARLVPDGASPDLAVRDQSEPNDFAEEAPNDLAHPRDLTPPNDLAPHPTCAIVLLTDVNEIKRWHDWVPGTLDLDWNAASPNSPNPNVPDQKGDVKQLAIVVDVVPRKDPGCSPVGLEIVAFDILTDFYIGPPCATEVDFHDGKGRVALMDCGIFYPNFPQNKAGQLSAGFFPLAADHMTFYLYLNTSRANPNDSLSITPRSILYLMIQNQREVIERVFENAPSRHLVYQ